MVTDLLLKVTKSMAGVVKGMDSALKSMNLEKVLTNCMCVYIEGFSGEINPGVTHSPNK